MAWMYTDAVNKVACPKCKQPAGKMCRIPSGGKSPTPHSTRVAALKALPDFNLDDYRVKVVRV